MTIASAFNDIAVAQGGTAAKSGSIAAAIDALNDALAGSDQPAVQTIEEAVRLLGQNIGGGGGTSTAKLYVYAEDYTNIEFIVGYTHVTVDSLEDVTLHLGDSDVPCKKFPSGIAAGEIVSLFTTDQMSCTVMTLEEISSVAQIQCADSFVMPKCDTFVGIA